MIHLCLQEWFYKDMSVEMCEQVGEKVNFSATMVKKMSNW